MLNYKKIVLSTTLAMAIMAPMAVYANPLKSNLPIERNEKAQQKQEKLQEKIERYDRVLQKAEELVPGTLEKGMAVLNERIELRTQIKDIRKEKIGAVILPLKEKLKAEVAAIKLQITSGELTKTEAKVKLEALQQENKTKIQNIKDELKSQNETEREAIKVKREVVRESFKNLVIAVKSKDAAIITDDFNSFLQSSKELNDMLKQLVSEITV
jgi:predicted translin family RNA/ssDNA-binding protein